SSSRRYAMETTDQPETGKATESPREATTSDQLKEALARLRMQAGKPVAQLNEEHNPDCAGCVGWHNLFGEAASLGLMALENALRHRAHRELTEGRLEIAMADLLRQLTRVQAYERMVEQWVQHLRLGNEAAERVAGLLKNEVPPEGGYPDSTESMVGLVGP